MDTIRPSLHQAHKSQGQRQFCLIASALLYCSALNRANNSFLRLQPIQHPRKWDRFSYVLDAAHPGRAAFDSHAKAGVRDAAEPAKVEIPFERFAWEAMRFDLLLEI